VVGPEKAESLYQDTEGIQAPDIEGLGSLQSSLLLDHKQGGLVF